MKNKHIHDRGYKNFFLNPVAVKQLLTSFVHENWVHDLDFDSLERMETSFVTDEFREKESDLIYKVQINGKDTYIYLLIEFQSTVDRFMALRMLRYITEFYQFLVKSQKLKRLPSVFPLLLYNGERKWTAPEDLSILIEQNIPCEYIPGFRFYKIAENEISKETLFEVKNLIAAMFYVENASPETLKKEIDLVAGMLQNERPEEIRIFSNWLRMTFLDTNDDIYGEVKRLEDVKTMFAAKLEKYGEKLRKEAMQKGLQKGLEKGIQKGMQKGKREGMREKALQMAKTLLNKNMSIQEISEITGLSVEEIKKL